MRRWMRTVGSAVTLALALLVLHGTARPQVGWAISHGCGMVANNATLDGSYDTRSVAVLSSLNAGEIITVIGGPPLGSTPSTPTQFSLVISGTVVATQSIPSTLIYVVPVTAAITGIGVVTNGGTATFDVSCKEPPSITFSTNSGRGKLLVTGYAALGVTSFDCFSDRSTLSSLAIPDSSTHLLTLGYTGTGFYRLFCFMDTTSEGFVGVSAGMMVLGPPYTFQTALQAPPPGFSFGGISGGCEVRPLILKNDGTQPYNINQMTKAGVDASSFTILFGGHQGSIPVGGARIVGIQACSAGFQPLSAILYINGSTGTGAGVPAPIRIALSANTGDD